jgi:hypothetical protein
MTEIKEIFKYLQLPQKHRSKTPNLCIDKLEYHDSSS